MANKETGRTQQSTDSSQNQERKAPGMGQNQSQGQDRQQSQDRQGTQGSRDESAHADKSSARIDQTDRKDL